MRRSTPRDNCALETLANSSVNTETITETYTCKGFTYKIICRGTKYTCETAFGMYTEIVINNTVSFDAAKEACQLHAIKNYKSSGRRSGAKVSKEANKQALKNIVKESADMLDAFLEYTKPCELTDLDDLGLHFDKDLW